MTYSLILYGSPHKLTKSHKLVTTRHQPPFYVRAELMRDDLLHALDKAKCYPEENLLNTQPVDITKVPANQLRKKKLT